MNIKKLIAGLLLSLSLTACSSTETITTPVEPLLASEVCCNDFSQFPWIQLNSTENINFQLDSSSPIGHFSDGNSYFSAFKLSDRSDKVQLSLASLMVNSSVVAPKLIALDAQFNIVKTVSLDEFGIKSSDAFTRTQFIANFTLNATQTPYFIIYSSQAALGQSVTVKHPARVRAEELGEARPMVTDPVYTYTRFGKLILSVNSVSLRAVKVPAKQVVPVVKTAQPETQVFYKNAITKAVQANDIPKALSLLEEAKGLGIKDAQSVFIEALNKK